MHMCTTWCNCVSKMGMCVFMMDDQCSVSGRRLKFEVTLRWISGLTCLCCLECIKVKRGNLELITRDRIMPILRVRRSLLPIISLFRIMVRSRLAKEKENALRSGCELHTSPCDFLHRYTAGLNVKCRNC
jgi:hypothetical protein